MTFTEKSRTSFEEKLVKQNEINRQMLVRELSKLDETEKRDKRILDNARQRFRSRYKKFGVVGAVTSTGSKAIDVRMYETHNPGFCYHCTGAIKESGPVSLSPVIVNSDDSYEFVRAMLFTNGEVDIEKLLCLHLLAAHTANNVDGRVTDLENNSSTLSDRDRSKQLSGAWNNFLPCYVVEIKRDIDETALQRKLRHETPQMTMENETLRDFELSYETYARDNADVVRALSTNDRMAKMAPVTLGKMPIISPHVYTLLGASHEFRVKRSIAEGRSGNAMRSNVHHSSVDSMNLDANVPKEDFRLFDDYPTNDINDVAIRHPFAKERNSFAADLKKNSLSRAGNSLRTSRDSSSICGKIDRSITMLKGKSWRNFDDVTKSWRTNETIRDNVTRDDDELVTIKPSYRILKTLGLKSICEKTDFLRSPQDRESAVSSANSWNITRDSSRCRKIRYRKRIYLNSPLKNFALKNREYRIVDIHVNNQIQALVHTVLEVLERVNPDKVQRVLETARDVEKICKILGRADIQTFMESLLGQPIVTSPRSFVVSQATAIDEIDERLESFVGDELIAMTLELPAYRCLGSIVEEIRDNIFGNLENTDVTILNECCGDPRRDESLIIDQRKGMLLCKDDTIRDDESPMKCKTKEIIDPCDPNAAISREASRVLGEFDQVKEKTIGVISEKNRYKVMKNSAIKRTSAIESNDKSKTVKSSSTNYKCQFKPQKAALDIGYMDPDRAILRRMTNSQRIFVGKMCASLKNRRINNEGLIRERTPLAALITPVLSSESIKMLTRGTIYSKFAGTMKHKEEKEEQMVARSESLTGPVLAKVRRDIAEHETKRRLDSFFAM